MSTSFGWFTKLEQDTNCLELNAPVATPELLTRAEAFIGVPLPESYKAFLQVYDGGDIVTSFLFSLQQLLQGVQVLGFKPYAGEIERVGNDYGIIYRAKPAHLLPFAQYSYSADLYCFDTRELIAGEYPICVFDHEVVELESLLRVRYPSFYTFLLDKSRFLVEDLDYFIDEEAADPDADLDRADAVAEQWDQRLRQMLEATGADLSRKGSAYKW